MKFYLIVLLSLAGFNAQADSCSLDLNEVKSAIDVQDRSQYLRLSRVSTNQASKTKKQTAVLTSGVPLKYTAGGCEHYSYSFVYSYKNLLKQVDQHNPSTNKNKYKNLMINMALELLSQTATTDSGKYEKEVLESALRAAQNDSSLEPSERLPGQVSYNIPCGDASCSVWSDNKKVGIDYSFAM